MYVAVKGGERAIDNAHAWLAEARRGDCAVQELSVTQIREQMALAVARVMAEGSLYDPDLAALAIKQARGDLVAALWRQPAGCDGADGLHPANLGHLQGCAGRAGAGADLRLHPPAAGFCADGGGGGARGCHGGTA
jgi:hypothetical protein